MKCPDCNGTGKSKYGYNQPCTHCYGKGFVEPLTNEEYIRTCSTAELVHEIHLMTSNCYVCGSDGVDYRRCYFRKKCTGPKEIEEWLKEIHK